ncbi:MAG: CvpA family protein [Candidatus Aquicultor sp.]
MLGFNLADVVIIVFLISWVVHGYWKGFLISSITLISFVISLFFAAKTYALLSSYANISYGLPRSYANLLAFLILFVTFHFLLEALLSRYVYPFVILSLSRHHLSRLDRLAGVIPTTLGGIIWLTIILGILSWFPISPYAKTMIGASKLGHQIVEAAAVVEPQAERIAGKAIEDTIASLTTRNDKEGGTAWKPNIPGRQAVEFDSGSEVYMLLLVNQERRVRGLRLLAFDPRLRNVARAHSMDMVRNNFFDHKSPTAGYPDERLIRAGIIFLADGENIAYSQDVDLAHSSLMASPGHRESILEPLFGKIGIGIVNAGPYGYMITQDFTN